MIKQHKVAIVMPAYNASKTLEQTYREIPLDVVDIVILVDDASQDDTQAVARKLGIEHIITHQSNKGYGGNQKTCYATALELEADIIIMLHPDYQYTPKLITAMASIIAEGVFPVVLGSRILGGGALSGGMPLYKYCANRLLTALQNISTGAKLSEYHTGYRAFSANVIRNLPLQEYSDNFIFDNQMLSQIIEQNHTIGEITCPTRYFDNASSIKLGPSVRYGLGVIQVSLSHLWRRMNRKNLNRQNDA
ncbi:glycosyltransferase family 2 protein [Gilvimarinus xylanilyticus]|uniref:Glycosyltransferase family 2 protein n=1 Tax=Gilvimarinus xylanilyticus TaxID=2944139 RepID=A0A9X2HXB9_9GAMM|nr:glycosyltransferase family 2 protein [Gilvimarinus xylanilyticus]MCP8899374.1 glycosyltransferase family 2 protein [Gilvimarinus xylanilyticus]